MEILYMGTAAAEGWPALFCDCDVCSAARRDGGKNLRTRTQALIDDSLIIDFPPDAYAHALRYGLNYGKMQHLLVTHTHMDHFFPVELIHRQAHFAHNPAGLFHVYGSEDAQRAFRAAVEIPRFETHPLKGDVEFTVIRPFESFEADGHIVTPIPADHDKREMCLVYLIEKDGKSIFYGHDTGVQMTDEAWKYLRTKKLDLVSLDCTMGTKQIGGYHMGIYDLPEFLEKLGGAVGSDTKVVMNHFSHNGGMTHDQLAAFGAERGWLCAYDGMRVTV